MQKLRPLLLILITTGCYIPNDPPKSEFSFGFPGRVERLEDAFYSSALNYKERDFNQYSQKTPEYEFVVTRSDTTINYVVTIQDCQSIYYLVQFNDNWTCDSSFIHVDKFSSNIGSLSLPDAKSIFKTEIIDRLTGKFNAIGNRYYWAIEKKQDTVFVKILDQKNSLRKLYVYSFDSVSNAMAQKQFISYMGDSTMIYQNDPGQRYVYLKNKTVVYK
jgi:hypothetical protein